MLRGEGTMARTWWMDYGNPEGAEAQAAALQAAHDALWEFTEGRRSLYPRPAKLLYDRDSHRLMGLMVDDGLQDFLTGTLPLPIDLGGQRYPSLHHLAQDVGLEVSHRTTQAIILHSVAGQFKEGFDREVLALLQEGYPHVRSYDTAPVVQSVIDEMVLIYRSIDNEDSLYAHSLLENLRQMEHAFTRPFRHSDTVVHIFEM
jgi:hypothetical protein